MEGARGKDELRPCLELLNEENEEGSEAGSERKIEVEGLTIVVERGGDEATTDTGEVIIGSASDTNH